MNIKRIVKEKIDSLTNRVDNSLIEYINRYISDDMSKIEKAIVIYLCLGDVLHYSPQFSLTYDYDNVYRTSEINLDKNEVMCKSWSVLYQRLLERFGIPAKLMSHKGHYRVQIPLDGVIYQADATGYGAFGMYYSMSDIARIKFGFKIEKFIVKAPIDPYNANLLVEKTNQLKDTIDNIYERQNRKVYPSSMVDYCTKRVMDMISSHSQKVLDDIEGDILYRIRIINRFWRLNITESPLEKVQLFNNFFKVVFGDFEEYESRSYNVYSKIGDKVVIYKLLVIEVDDEFYYFLDNGNEFLRYSSEELLKEFDIRNIMIPNRTDIIGIYGGIEKYKYIKK